MSSVTVTVTTYVPTFELSTSTPSRCRQFRDVPWDHASSLSRARCCSNCCTSPSSDCSRAASCRAATSSVSSSRRILAHDRPRLGLGSALGHRRRPGAPVPLRVDRRDTEAVCPMSSVTVTVPPANQHATPSWDHASSLSRARCCSNCCTSPSSDCSRAASCRAATSSVSTRDESWRIDQYHQPISNTVVTRIRLHATVTVWPRRQSHSSSAAQPRAG